MTTGGLAKMRSYDNNSDGNISEKELKGAVGEYLFGENCEPGALLWPSLCRRRRL